MKFGIQLESEVFEPWRLSYIQYDVLKSELKHRQMDHVWDERDEKDFIELLDNELDKVYTFIAAKMSEIESRITYCERTLQTFMNNPSAWSNENWNLVDSAITEVLFDVNDLARFTRINYIGFQKILKKHDKWTQLHLQQDFVQKLREKPLDNQRFDVAIVFLSALHDICKLKGQPRTGDSAAGGDQSAFERATSKYWIHPQNVTEVKAIIMLHLPVLIFNADKRFEPSDSAISSVYFDNEDFDLYAGRLQRDENAEAIRFRWYGPMTSKSIFIERKTHHASWNNGVSVKDRFRLDYEDVQPFITGELSVDEYVNRLRANGVDEEIVQANRFIAEGVQNSIMEKQLKPLARIFYNRTAFQLPGDQRVRLSLDTDLTFIREDSRDGKERRGPNEWRRPDVGIDYPFAYLDEPEILRFPFAVLETKLQTHLGQEPPEWLNKLLSSHLVHEVPRFSKYLHAAATLHHDALSLMPWWLPDINNDIRKPRETNFGLTRSKSFKPLIDGRYSNAMKREAQRMGVMADTVKSRNSIRSAHRSVPATQMEKEQQLQQQQQQKQEEQQQEKQQPQPQPAEQQQPKDGAESPYLEPVSENSTKKTASGSLYLHQAPSNSSGYWDDVAKHQRGDSTLMVGGAPPVSYDSATPIKIEGDVASTSPAIVVTGANDVEGQAQPADEKKSRGMHRFWGAPNQSFIRDPNNPNEIIPLKKVKVEPKVFFANERTFISWLQFCALLLTVSLSLLNFGDSTSRIAGAIFIGIAAVVAIYALYRFEKRAW
ncbi:vacuolar transporter chaperone [Apophysomyces sp. BC1021]|nr:vacuolar transporter chaperone [Apophysomyces sp. BC1021]